MTPRHQHGGALRLDTRAQEHAFLRLDPMSMADFVRRGEPVAASFLERARIVLQYIKSLLSDEPKAPSATAVGTEKPVR